MERSKTRLKLYRGEGCVEVFCDYVDNEAKSLYRMFPKKPMNHLTPKELQELG